MGQTYPRKMLWVMREEPTDGGVRYEDGMRAVNTLYIDGQHGQSLHGGISPPGGGQHGYSLLVLIWRTAAGSADIFERRSSDTRGQVAHDAEAGVALAAPPRPGFAAFWAPLVLIASGLHFA